MIIFFFLIFLSSHFFCILKCVCFVFLVYLFHLTNLQEIELLTMMESRRQQDPQGPLPFSNSSTTSGLPPSYPPPPVPSKSTGIEVTRFFKVGDQVLSKRELVKSTVFTPSMAAPTVSVEEYGDYLLDQMQQQQRQQQQDQQQKLMDGIDDRPIRK